MEKDQVEKAAKAKDEKAKAEKSQVDKARAEKAQVEKIAIVRGKWKENHLDDWVPSPYTRVIIRDSSTLQGNDRLKNPR